MVMLVWEHDVSILLSPWENKFSSREAATLLTSYFILD